MTPSASRRAARRRGRPAALPRVAPRLTSQVREKRATPGGGRRAPAGGAGPGAGNGRACPPRRSPPLRAGGAHARGRSPPRRRRAARAPRPPLRTMAPGRELGAFLLALLACCGGRRLAEAAGGPGGRRGAAADACGGRVSSAGLGPAAAQVGRCCREGSGCGAGGAAAAAGLCGGSAAGRNRGVPGGDAEWDFPSVRAGRQVINVVTGLCFSFPLLLRFAVRLFVAFFSVSFFATFNSVLKFSPAPKRGSLSLCGAAVREHGRERCLPSPPFCRLSLRVSAVSHQRFECAPRRSRS